MTNAVRNKQPTFVEALQCISDLPLNPRKALAIGRVETLVDYHGPHDVGRVDRRPHPTKRVEHAPRQFSMLEPKIGLPDSLRRYCRQADLMSAQRLVCLRHDAAKPRVSRPCREGTQGPHSGPSRSSRKIQSTKPVNARRACAPQQAGGLRRACAPQQVCGLRGVCARQQPPSPRSPPHSRRRQRSALHISNHRHRVLAGPGPLCPAAGAVA
jgi:hypothetical protein